MDGDYFFSAGQRRTKRCNIGIPMKLTGMPMPMNRLTSVAAVSGRPLLSKHEHALGQLTHNLRPPPRASRHGLGMAFTQPVKAFAHDPQDLLQLASRHSASAIT
jgi:hypothetical protein